MCMCAYLFESRRQCETFNYGLLLTFQFSTVTESSIIAIQIFDQKKFKKKDQGFLGVINTRVGDVIDVMMDGEGLFP